MEASCVVQGLGSMVRAPYSDCYGEGRKRGGGEVEEDDGKDGDAKMDECFAFASMEQVEIRAPSYATGQKGG